MLIYLNLLVIFSPLLACGCNDFSVSSCYPDSTQVIITVPLPPSPTAASTCSSLCNIQENCLYWFVDGSSSTCSLLHYSFLSSCLSISGTEDLDISVCLDQDSGTCGDLVDQDCEFTGTLLLNTTSVVDAYACQDYLQVLGPVNGAAYFSYNSRTSICSLYESSARSCPSLSGPRGDLVEKCQDSTTPGPSTISTTASPTRGSEVVVAGSHYTGRKAYNTYGVCASFYPHPENGLGPMSMTFLNNSVLGCGAWSCDGEGCDFIDWSTKCWTFNIMDGWSEKAHPYDSPSAWLDDEWRYLFGGLVNVNEKVYYVGWRGNVMEYNEINDSWSEVSRIPNYPVYLNGNCVLSIGNMEIFVKTEFRRQCFKFNTVTKEWTQLNNYHYNITDDHCVVVDLPSTGKGVLSVGGKIDGNRTRITELLDLRTGVWTTTSPTVYDYYGDLELFIMDGKPTASTWYDEYEQYDVQRDVWEKREFNDGSYIGSTAINVPKDMFPDCNINKNIE